METAGERSILILNPGTAKCEVRPVFVFPGNAIAVPSFWMVAKNLVGATLFSSACERYVVRKVRVAGVASRRSLDAPWLDYLVLLTLGVPMLGFPLKIKLDTDLIGQESLATVKTELINAIKENPDRYTETLPRELIARVKCSKSMAWLHDALIRD